jgi:hypothetical protein
MKVGHEERTVQQLSSSTGSPRNHTYSAKHITAAQKVHKSVSYTQVRICALKWPFLGAFAKLREATINFVMSAWNNSAPTGRILMKLDIWEFLESLSRKFKFN